MADVKTLPVEFLNSCAKELDFYPNWIELRVNRDKKFVHKYRHKVLALNGKYDPTYGHIGWRRVVLPTTKDGFALAKRISDDYPLETPTTPKVFVGFAAHIENSDCLSNTYNVSPDDLRTTMDEYMNDQANSTKYKEAVKLLYKKYASKNLEASRPELIELLEMIVSGFDTTEIRSEATILLAKMKGA